MPFRNTITVSVSKEDIRAGKPKSYWECPVAVAFIRAFTKEEYKEALDVSVRPSGNIKIVLVGGESIWYSTPNETAAFIRTVDTQGKRAAKPFEFIATRGL